VLLGSDPVFCRDWLGIFFSRQRFFLYRIGSLSLLVTAVMKLLVGGLLLHSYSLTQIAELGHGLCVSIWPMLGWNGVTLQADNLPSSVPYNDGHASVCSCIGIFQVVQGGTGQRSWFNEKWFSPISKPSIASPGPLP
jgi:hypothetical protein